MCGFNAQWSAMCGLQGSNEGSIVLVHSREGGPMMVLCGGGRWVLML